MDPDSFTVARTVTVRDHRGRVDELNELEFIEGKVYANRWHHDDILVIDPISGNVEATLNLAGLERPRPRDPESVLNGIAYDPESGLLHVTGKCWPGLCFAGERADAQILKSIPGRNRTCI